MFAQDLSGSIRHTLHRAGREKNREYTGKTDLSACSYTFFFRLQPFSYSLATNGQSDELEMIKQLLELKEEDIVLLLKQYLLYVSISSLLCSQYERSTAENELLKKTIQEKEDECNTVCKGGFV
jgi:hypothetical protein